jgi:hypothetical protein
MNMKLTTETKVGFLFVIAVALFVFSASQFGIAFNKEEKYYKSRIGSKVAINNDTLTITDYSILNNNFTLCNGTKLSIEYFKNDPAK